MLFLLNKQNQALLEDKQQIEDLNQELLTALEQLKKKNSEFQKVLVTDSLTGLFNRQNLLPVLEDEIGRCHRYGHYLALMKIDIDKFKSFNDEYGYQAGDKMLAYAGKIIRKNIRKFDKAFRYSGEEFIVVLPETDQTLAYIAAERIRKSFQNKTFAVSKKKSQSGRSTSCTVSIGITALFSYKTSDLSIEELINQSNAALNAAKEKGGNISVRYE
jgi:diguanylate cyclase (GGDEF)-like protein